MENLSISDIFECPGQASDDGYSNCLEGISVKHTFNMRVLLSEPFKLAEYKLVEEYSPSCFSIFLTKNVFLNTSLSIELI